MIADTDTVGWFPHHFTKISNWPLIVRELILLWFAKLSCQPCLYWPASKASLPLYFIFHIIFISFITSRRVFLIDIWLTFLLSCFLSLSYITPLLPNAILMLFSDFSWHWHYFAADASVKHLRLRTRDIQYSMLPFPLMPSHACVIRFFLTAWFCSATQLLYARISDTLHTFLFDIFAVYCIFTITSFSRLKSYITIACLILRSTKTAVWYFCTSLVSKFTTFVHWLSGVLLELYSLSLDGKELRVLSAVYLLRCFLEPFKGHASQTQAGSKFWFS